MRRYVEVPAALVDEFSAIVGEEYAFHDTVTRWAYSRDASPLPPVPPALVLVPGSVEEVRQILMLANRHKIPIYPRSSGANLWGGAIPYLGGISLDMRRFNRILSIDEELFSCTCEPAVSFAVLQETLRNYKEGYYNLVSPEGAVASCIGGSFMAHGDGIGSALWGTQGDAVIGCKVVLPNGDVVVTGSAANPYARENAGGTGQFFRYAYAHDLTGLFCGSEGTLGVLVEVTTRIERLPARYGFATFEFDSVADACNTLYRARQERIQATFAALRERRSLEAVNPGSYPEAQLVYILEGDPVVVERQMEILRGIVRQHGGRESASEIAEKYWEKRFGLVPGGMYKLGSRALLPLHYPLGRMAWFYERIRETCEEIIVGQYNLAYFIGGFQINTAFVCYPTIMYLEQYPLQYETVMECARKTQERLLRLGGAPIEIGRLWAGCMRELGAHYDLIKTLKRAVDPNNIMSPGLLDLPIDDYEVAHAQ